MSAPSPVADERELLGCIIAGADPTDLRLNDADFYDPRHGWIFQACLDVADSGRRCDPQTVAAALGENLTKIDKGVLGLVEISEHAIPRNVDTFAARVRNAADRRNLVDIAHKIVQYAEGTDRDPGDIREDARKWLETPGMAESTTRTMADLLPGYIDSLQHGKAPGLATPWPDLDWLISGLQPGRLYTIGGRPGGGKSVMMSNIAAHFAINHQAPVFFATLEMPKNELISRIIAARAQVALTNLINRSLSENDWQKVRHHYAVLESMPLHINDEPQTLRSLRRGARDAKRQGGLGLVVVDYLQLITPPDGRISRQQQIGEITRALKVLAKELEVPVLTASQLRRPQNAKDEPTMSDLRESGDIEADSDAVILLHTPDEAKPWELTAFVRKNRSGPKGPVPLFFDTGRACMNSAERSAAA